MRGFEVSPRYVFLRCFLKEGANYGDICHFVVPLSCGSASAVAGERINARKIRRDGANEAAKR